MEKLYQLYQITNKQNNKKYIGQVIQTKGYKRRFKEHINSAIKGSNHCLHLAIAKYGVEQFEVRLLMHNIPESDIDRLEILWIEKYQTYFRLDKGYNMTFGGQGVHGVVFSSESLSSKSEKMKQYWEELKKDPVLYQKAVEQRRQNMLGREFSYMHKKHLSEQAKTRVGEKNPFYGKSHSDSTKQMISDANRKNVGMYDKETNNLIMEFKSLVEATEYVLNQGITKNKNASSRISKICNGQDKTAYGYVWRFL